MYYINDNVYPALRYTSISQDQLDINSRKQYFKSYLNHLYSEANLVSNKLITLEEIESYATSPEGLRAFNAFLSIQPLDKAVSPKEVGKLLGELL